MLDMEKIEKVAFAKAHILLQNKMVHDMEFFELADLMIKMELEKYQKQKDLDSLIDFNDEIVSIEEMGELDTIDISVTGDQLFYCNNILTKNSMGTAHTADAIFALISSEELESMGQLMIKQLKNRWGDLSYYRRFVVGIDRSKMKLYNLEDSAQGNIQSESNEKKDKPVFDKTTFGEKWDDVPSKRSKKKFELENIQ